MSIVQVAPTSDLNVTASMAIMMILIAECFELRRSACSVT